MSHKFKHSPMFDHQRGRVKVTCSCGAQSRLLGTEVEAREAHKLHVGLKELEGQQRLH